MRYVTDSGRCPQCGHTYLIRRRRRLWMRLIGIDKHYRCEACRCQVLYREGKPESAPEHTEHDD